MGSRGPTPTPTKTLKLRGSWRANSKRRPPQPPPVLPKPPDWIGADARELWMDLAPKLSRLGLLTELDVGAFTILCVTWGHWREADRYIAQHGDVYTNAAGLEKRHPMSGIASDTAKMLLTLCGQFGLTPLSRQRLQVPPPPDPDGPPDGHFDFYEGA